MLVSYLRFACCKDLHIVAMLARLMLLRMRRQTTLTACIQNVQTRGGSLKTYHNTMRECCCCGAMAAGVQQACAQAGGPRWQQRQLVSNGSTEVPAAQRNLQQSTHDLITGTHMCTVTMAIGLKPVQRTVPH
jgi:hypothetical protein